LEASREIQEKLAFEDRDALRAASGPQGNHFKVLGEHIGVDIAQRGNQLTLKGEREAVRVAKRTLEQIYLVAQGGGQVDEGDMVRAASWNRRDPGARADRLNEESIYLAKRKKTIVAKTPTQKAYLSALRKSSVVFGIGPAGTGKTYLAMAMAVSALKAHRVRRIVLTRPAVEAGEKLGYLPGSITEKVNPYLRPLYDALHDMLDVEEVDRLLSQDIVEVAPLAFMRGRTLNESFVILDEAQNTTVEQMKMFLTRLGEHSQAVITGDVTQTDLPRATTSGLVHAERVLSSVEGIEFVRFASSDVLRHSLVQKIVQAYEKDAQKKPVSSGKKKK